MSKRMRACPFCDEKKNLVISSATQGYSDIMFYRGECWHCGCKGPVAEGWEDALEAWNKNPAPKICGAGRPLNCS